jgi:hypothetical protein
MARRKAPGEWRAVCVYFSASDAALLDRVVSEQKRRAADLGLGSQVSVSSVVRGALHAHASALGLGPRSRP